MSSNRPTVSLVTAPASEPVTAAEARSYMRVDASTEDTLIESLITAARETVEHVTGRALLTQTWRVNLREWPVEDEDTEEASIILPRTPVASVTSLKYYAEGEVAQTTVSSSNYQAFLYATPARLILSEDYDLPDLADRPDAVEVVFVAGATTSAAVPRTLRTAVLLVVAHLFENRQPLNIGNIVNELPYSLKHLLEQNRVGGFVA